MKRIPITIAVGLLILVTLACSLFQIHRPVVLPKTEIPPIATFRQRSRRDLCSPSRKPMLPPHLRCMDPLKLLRGSV